jgi:hypothetical protein
MAYKQKSPYKFLGKALRKMGRGANRLMGRRGGGGAMPTGDPSAAAQTMPGMGIGGVMGALIWLILLKEQLIDLQE